MLQRVAACCSVLQRIAVCCEKALVRLRRKASHVSNSEPVDPLVCCSVLQCAAAVCCSVLQCVAVCCSVLQKGTCSTRKKGFSRQRLCTCPYECSLYECSFMCHVRQAHEPHRTYECSLCHSYVRPGTASIHMCHRRNKFYTNLVPYGRIRQVQNSTSCHYLDTMNLDLH